MREGHSFNAEDWSVLKNEVRCLVGVDQRVCGGSQGFKGTGKRVYGRRREAQRGLETSECRLSRLISHHGATECRHTRHSTCRTPHSRLRAHPDSLFPVLKATSYSYRRALTGS